MITLMIIALLLGILLIAICTGCMILIDPIIAILTIYLIVKFIKFITRKKNK